LSSAIPKQQLIVIGCSAGGVEALSILLASLPVPFPAPIVIAQHLDPTRPSHLSEVLARRSKLPLHKLDQPTKLEPGIVYIVPSGFHVQIQDHTVQRVAAHAERPKPSVDMLLDTAAEAYGEDLIAVILTGMGSDGTIGARRVKERGGTVLIENPATAKFPSMPESLDPAIVDMVLDIDRIGVALYALVTKGSASEMPGDERHLKAVLEVVRERSGIDFSKYKPDTILRRLQRRIVATESRSTLDYLSYLEDHAEEPQRLASSFLIKVTEFMRDPELFAYLRGNVLPELIAHARKDGKLLRIWSAGCATGEEAYSIAILVSELLGDELDDFTIRIFSTDVDREAIVFARRGTYSASAVEALAPELIERYFVMVDGRYQVKKRLRNLTVFGEHDLGQRSPFPKVDLVLCRNVLIYFTAELQRRALQLFGFSLRDGGYLVLGKAESTSPLHELFALHDLHQKVYVRCGARVLIPPTRIEPLPARGLRDKPMTLPPNPPKEVPRSRMPIDTLLMSLPMGAVIVDRRYDILEINLTARRILGVHGPATGQDFVHLAQAVPHRLLLDAIDAAFRGDALAPIDVALDSVGARAAAWIQIACFPPHAEPGAQKRECVLILITDVTEGRCTQGALEAMTADKAKVEDKLEELRASHTAQVEGLYAENQRLVQQNEALRAQIGALTASHQAERANVTQLAESNRRLVLDNEAITADFEQLQSANEELLIAGEESQAAMEEVETLNEELQATNEELETLNEELQATIEELNTTNGELEARSNELQELSVPLEAERARLAAILRSLGDGLLVVDASGRPILTNDAYKTMLGERKSALTDNTGRALRPEETPEQRASYGERFQMEFVALGPDKTSRHFEALGQPIAEHGTDAHAGGVVVIRDITDRSIRKLQDRFMAMASHELRTPLVPLHGYLDMLLDALPKAPESEPIRRFAELAQKQASRLEKLVDDLMSATRIRTGKFQLTLEPLDLRSVVAHAVELSRMMPGSMPVHSTMPAGNDPLLVNGDAARLEQVVLNLLGNAFRYADASPHVDVRLRLAGRKAELEVEDYGPGIPVEQQRQLFTSFYQVDKADRSSRAGMGLGLHICKEIVTMHGGQISVRSEGGRGSTFSVSLPRLESRAQVTEPRDNEGGAAQDEPPDA
jgi:two-component system, chemotaxis family, CheB/CheR fusion protein